MSLKRHLEFAKARLGATRSLLNDVPDTAVIERFSLEQRILAAEEEARSADQAFTNLGELDLTFEGTPVVGTTGVDAEFAGASLTEFTKVLIAATAVKKSGEQLGQRGPLPETGSRIQVSDIARGSFGFTLTEVVEGQQPVVPTPMKQASIALIGMLSALTEEGFSADAWEVADSRVLSSLRRFLDVCDRSGAQFKIYAGDAVFRADSQAGVHLLKERVDQTTVEEDTTTVDGVLLGVLPESRQFEYRVEESGTVIYGAIHASIADVGGLQNMVGVPVSAQVWVKRLVRTGYVRENRILVAIHPRNEGAVQ